MWGGSYTFGVIYKEKLLNVSKCFSYNSCWCLHSFLSVEVCDFVLKLLFVHLSDAFFCIWIASLLAKETFLSLKYVLIEFVENQ